jgi:hypothetical protein
MLCGNCSIFFHCIFSGSVFALLGCIFFTIGMVAFVGMMLGILYTKKPTSLMEIGRTKAGSCGACLLMTYLIFYNTTSFHNIKRCLKIEEKILKE